MGKIKVIQQVLNPNGIGGVTAEFNSLMKSSILNDSYELIPMVLVNCHSGINYKDILFYYRFIKSHNPDVVHVRGVASDGLNAIIAAKLFGKCKILVTVHGMYSDLDRIGRLKRWVSKNIIEDLSFALSDGISCVCKTAAGRSRFDKFRGKMLPFVYNRIPSFDLSSRDEDRKRVRSEYDIPDDAILGVFVGRISNEKGMGYFKDAVSLLDKDGKPYYFILVGTGPEYDSLVDFKQELNFVKIFLTGDQRNVLQYYNSADYFFLPSLHENFSISILEACAAKLPLLVTHVGGAAEIVTEDIGQLIQAKDSNALYKSLQDMTNTELLTKYKNNILLKDFSRFKSNSVDKSLDTVYQLLLN